MKNCAEDGISPSARRDFPKKNQNSLHVVNTCIVTLAKVLIIEDDTFLRSTIATVLKKSNFEVVASVGSAREALFSDSEIKPEVLVVDLDLGPGPNGIDIAHTLRQRHTKLGIVMLTSFSDPRLFKKGNRQLPTGTQYFTKSQVEDVSLLMTAILRAKHFPLASVRRSNYQINELSEKQIEIFRLVSEGFTTASIASQRGVSEKSIEAAISRIHQILSLPRAKNLNPRVQLTRAYFSLTGKKNLGESYE